MRRRPVPIPPRRRKRPGNRRRFRHSYLLARTASAALRGATPSLWNTVLRESQHFTSDPVSELGPRVRELRHDRGMTLKGLGREAGLSHPFLSQLERGLARPSVMSVERIARALDVPVSTLWTTPRHAPARVVRAPDAEHGARGVRDLIADRSALRVREWTGGSRSWPDERDTTTGEVMVYVVRGAVEIDLDGEVHVLREGDAVFFDGMVRHRLRRRGGKRTRALYIATG